MTDPSDPSQANQTSDSSVDTMSGAFDARQKGVYEKPLFTEEQIDIFVNKEDLETYFFHQIDVDYNNLKQLEYDPMDYSVIVRRHDNTAQNLGIKIGWMIRPYFTRAKFINIVQTKEGKSINGTAVPLVTKVRDQS